MSGAFFERRVLGSTLELFGDLRLQSLDETISAIRQLTVKSGYSDITINMSNVTSVTKSVMPPLASYARYLRQEYRIDFDIVESRAPVVKNFIRKHGLLYHFDPSNSDKPKTNSSDPIILQFKDHDEREVAVDRIVNAALRATSLGRQHIAALDWAVNEITDNVLTHSSSKTGGFIISHKLYNSEILEFVVADCGVGIARSLSMLDEAEAVERAIQEGVTRNKTTNQGNGLYGTYRLGLASAGVFVLKSRHGNLYVTKEGVVRVRRDQVPFPGTFLVCQIDCSQPDLIERAFVFGGRSHTPAFDYLERKHEQGSDGETNVMASEICKTFGSRQSGGEARKYLRNLLEATPSNVLVVDFDGINVVSSSFADEVFGKLFVELGPMRFMRNVKLKNTVSAVEALIDRAITLRAQSGLCHNCNRDNPAAVTSLNPYPFRSSSTTYFRNAALIAV